MVIELDILEKFKLLEKKGVLQQFFNLSFNLDLKDNSFEFHIQSIKDDIILYIFDYANDKILYTFEFVNKDNDVYVEKSLFKNAIINTVYLKKCFSLYESKEVDDNLVRLGVCLLDGFKEDILKEYLDENIVSVLIDKS